MVSRKNIEKTFSEKLERYLYSQDEEILAAVYELGRNAINEGIGELEILRLYHDALANIKKNKNGKTPENHTALALDFLTEFLAPYEMRQRGFGDLIKELNKQNKQLKEEVEQRIKTEEELKQSKEHFQHLIENALDIITVINYDGTIKYGSPSVERVLGYKPEDLIEKNILNYIHPDDVERVREQLTALSKTLDKTITIEFRVKHKDSTWRHLESIAKNVKNVREGPGVIVNSRDLTERVINHKKLQENQQKLAVAQQIAHLGNWEWYVQADELYWSDEMCAIYGLEPGSWPSSFEAYLDYIHPDDAERIQKSLQNALENKSEFEFEHRIVLADGTERSLYCKGEVEADENGDALKMVGIGQDITRIKETEDQLRRYSEKLKNYMAKEEKTREDERIRIAREIHDELGQMLTVLKLDMSMVKNDAKLEFNLDSDSEFLDDMGIIVDKIDTIIKSVQRISKDLRPDIFDHLGLDEAIQWQVKEFERRTGIKCNMTNEANCIEQIVDERSIAIYRIFQETLTNILRHSDATKVDISLTETEDYLILKIKDNGVGISEQNMEESTSLGIIGMKERSEFLRGEISIYGQKGVGTKVTLKIPMQEAKEPDILNQSI